MSTALYLGVDIGKSGHVAAFLSTTLLKKHSKFERCPTLRVENSRVDFEKLFASLCVHTSPGRCHILVEKTGHYAFALEQFLFEHGCKLYRIHARKRYGKNKTDKHDAQGLAVLLYNQIELKTPVTDKALTIYPLIPPTEDAQLLRGVAQRRLELQSAATMCKNKLTALADELFPELQQIYKDPNNAQALSLRSVFPTPADVATAPLEKLYATRSWSVPGNKQFATLKELARTTIGTKNPHRQRSIAIEQRQLIEELRLHQQHIAELDREIERVLATSRAGQILMSFVGVGPVHAASLIAGIGNIANFESASKLRGYAGWSPKRSQTGTSFDRVSITKGGNALLKPTLFLITEVAVVHDPRWKALYDRLVPRKCWYDARTKKWKGKMKVIGRVAGQILGVMFTLLKRDADLLASLPRGAVAPPPELYRRGMK